MVLFVVVCFCWEDFSMKRMYKLGRDFCRVEREEMRRNSCVVVEGIVMVLMVWIGWLGVVCGSWSILCMERMNLRGWKCVLDWIGMVLSWVGVFVDKCIEGDVGYVECFYLYSGLVFFFVFCFFVFLELLFYGIFLNFLIFFDVVFIVIFK